MGQFLSALELSRPAHRLTVLASLRRLTTPTIPTAPLVGNHEHIGEIFLHLARNYLVETHATIAGG
jgi:hypothetical protein